MKVVTKIIMKQNLSMFFTIYQLSDAFIGVRCGLRIEWTIKIVNIHQQLYIYHENRLILMSWLY
jgi:hypothetical protein